MNFFDDIGFSKWKIGNCFLAIVIFKMLFWYLSTDRFEGSTGNAWAILNNEKATQKKVTKLKM